MKSFVQTKETVDRKWYVIDAEGKSLGRVASKAAHILRGKHKVTYTPNIDCGDFVIIINSKEVNLTGNKLNDKMYYNHSMYAGGLRERNAKVMIEKYPNEMMERAVKGMLPHNRLGRQMYRKLFVYEGQEHPHMAQKPVVLELDK
ncbi:MAG: 50S ribosomal protein L13 [Bacilli bacterium]|nr:50S ribosomal protein L13 [Bacilli bacterium]